MFTQVHPDVLPTEAAMQSPKRTGSLSRRIRKSLSVRDTRMPPPVDHCRTLPSRRPRPAIPSSAEQERLLEDTLARLQASRLLGVSHVPSSHSSASLQTPEPSGSQPEMGHSMPQLMALSTIVGGGPPAVPPRRPTGPPPILPREASVTR